MTKAKDTAALTHQSCWFMKDTLRRRCRAALAHTIAMRKQRVAIVGAALVSVAAAAGGFLWFRAREQARLREGHTVAEAMHRVTRLATVEMTVSDWRLRRDEEAPFRLLPLKCRQ